MRPRVRHVKLFVAVRGLQELVRTRLAKHWVAIALIGGVLVFVVIAYLVLRLAPDWFAETRGLDAKGRVEARQGVRTAALALFAGALAVIGSIYTARTFALNRAGQLTDRFTKAIEQLGHKELDVRLGGIYALERIARDSKDDHPQVVEVLTAYVREHAPRATTDLNSTTVNTSDQASTAPTTSTASERERPATDVQAALTVLARRSLEHERARMPQLDLATTRLANVRLPDARFAGADLRGADLRGADLRGANLSGANLSRANLTRTDLSAADLSAANLIRANLIRADLSAANLIRANLIGADLREAHFRGADLREAHLREADLREASGIDPNAAGSSEGPSPRINGAEDSTAR